MLALNFATSAQTINISGDHEMKVETRNGLIISKLTLSTDGAFVFHEYDNLQQRIPKEANKYGKGTWTADKKLFYFSQINLILTKNTV